MSNLSLDLSNRLPGEQVDIIHEVVLTADSEGLGVCIVGAQARDLLLQYAYELPVYRATNDIDFGIAVSSWHEFTRLQHALIANKKFASHKTMRQRLVHEGGFLIDLVPFGGLEEVSGQISWPPDFSIVMSTIGFHEAYDHSIVVRIAGDLVVKVASLAGLALMKIVAWDKRRFERDAEDLALIMRHYLDAGNQDRVYTETGDCFDLLNKDFDYERASARILGRDVGRLLTATSRRLFERVLSREVDRQGAGNLARVLLKNKASLHGDYDNAIAMLVELHTGAFES